MKRRAEEMRLPPLIMLKEIYNLFQAGAILSIPDRLLTLGPGYEAFAAQIRAYVEDFQEDALESYLRHHLQNTE